MTLTSMQGKLLPLARGWHGARLRAARALLVLGAVVGAALANAQTTSSTALTVSPNPASYGQAATFTATVSGSSPSGTVTFSEGSSVLGSSALSSGVAAFSIADLSVGSHAVTASYAGDAANTSSTSAPVSLAVNKAATSISKPTSSVNPSTFGTAVTFTVTVTGQSPSGTVSFSNPGYTYYGSAPLTGTGNTRTASFTISTLSGGADPVAGSYSGDANNLAVSDSYPLFTQTVQKASTTTTVSTSAASTVYPASTTITATVAGAGTPPTGNVSFREGSIYLGNASLVNGAASITKALSAGAHSITAQYEGSSDHLISTSAPFTTNVERATATVSLTSSANPAAAGQAVNLIASVTGAGPSGTVSFFDGSNSLGTAASAAGTATLSVSTLSAGTHMLTAVYAGDLNNTGATSAAYAQQVSQGGSATTLSTSSSTPALGEALTLTARVAGLQPTGNVTFSDGGAALGSATLAGGEASLTLSNLGAGAHTLTASYPGDSSNGASTSAAVTVTVGTRAPYTWQYGYDGAGRPNTSVDPNGQPTYFYYDALGRRIQAQQPANTGSSTPTVTQFGYDPMDALTSVTDPRSLATTYTRDGLGQSKAQSSPDTGGSSFTYDAKGNVLTSTDARGKTTSFVYDSLDRVTTITYPTGTATTFEYDGGSNPTPAAAGELTKMTDESGNTSYSYDGVGRLAGKTVVIGSQTFTVGYSWGDSGSALDKLTAITYPSGTRVNYAYDQYGSISGITVYPVNANGQGVSGTAVTLLSGVTYNVDNVVSGWLWSDGKARTIGFDSNGLVSSYNLGDPLGTGNAAGLLRSIQRDAAGRITGYTHTSGGNPASSFDQTFGYDNLDRLTSATQASTTTQYSYDETGNRTAKTVGGTTYTNTISAASNRLNQVQDATGTATISHDAAGNVVGDGSFTFTYSDRGRMASVTTPGGTVSYLYNGMGQRAKKSGPTSLVATGASHFVYDESGQLLGEYDASGNPVYETIYLVSTPVGVLKQTGTAATTDIVTTVYNVYADHIDTPRLITRQDQTIVWRWDAAEAFGATAPDQNPSGQGTFAYNQRFPGQVFDAETGLLQNWNRDYDARAGRYRQSDPIGLAGGINTFAYVGGHPLRLTDLTGLAPGRDDSPGKWGPFIVDPSAAARGNILDRLQRWWYDCRCEALEAEIQNTAQEMRERALKGLEDEHNLYEKAYVKPLLGRRKGTYAGHQKQFRDLQKHLRDLIETADSRGCYVAPWDRQLATMGEPPERPAAR